MSSILKVDTIQDQAGNNIINESGNVITIGASGDTITVPAGATVSGFTSAGIDDNATSTAITISSAEDVTFTEDILLGDSKKAIFGAGSDLQIYHDGSHSFIADEGTGNLTIKSNGAGIELQKGNSEYLARFKTDNAVELYYDNAKKFETTATGATVTGNLVTTGDITTGNNGSLFILDNAGQKSGQIQTDSSAANALQIDADPDNSASGSYIGFRIDNSEKVRIDNVGSLGLGTTAPFNTRPGSLTISNEAPTLYMEDTNGSGSKVGQLLYQNAVLTYSIGSRNGTGTNNSTTHLTINDVGNVGIGGPPATVNQRLFIEGDNSNLIMAEIKNIGGPSALQITADNGTDCRITFGDLADNGRGRIIYSNTDESMRFDVNNLSEKMRIDSSGNLLVGKTSTTNSVPGSKFGSGGQIVATVANDDIMILNRTGSNGKILRFFKDTSEVGAIDVLSTGIGITLGGTGTANKLDDYEEGNHAAAFTTSSGSITIGRNDLAYTKIGRQVTLTGEINISSVSSPVSPRLSLPFVIASHTVDRNMNFGAFVSTYSVPFNGDNQAVSIYGNTGNSYVGLLYLQDNGAFGAYTASAGDTFFINFTYFTN